MSDEEYREWVRFCKRHKGKIVFDSRNDDERLYLSKHQYTDDHETVVQAGLWKDQTLNFSNYRTFISRELDNGRPGRGSIVNGGEYHETREEAIEWLEEKAKEFGGSPLNWEEREVVEYNG